MMVPYYDQDGITIYHGDALDVLRSGAVTGVAAVIMDPPYASGTRKEAGRPSSGAMVRGRFSDNPIENDQMTTTGFVWLIRETLSATKPQLREGASVLSFIDWRQWPSLVGAVESVNLRVNGMIVWDKMQIGMGSGFRNQHELILHASKGVSIMADKGTPNVLQSQREPLTDHPAPKPVKLCERLILAVTERGDLVFDPFMGSGPVALACANLGRRYIGVELVEQYCEVAVGRLGQLAFQL